MPKPRYRVIRDTREKEGHGWEFSMKARCDGTSHGALETGDYSLVGYEHKFTIERKGSVAEFVQNLCQKRFVKELERLREFEHAFIILEFTMDDIINYPYSANLPKKVRNKIVLDGRAVLAKFNKMLLDYPNVHVIYAGDKGKEIALSLFKRVVEKYE